MPSRWRHSTGLSEARDCHYVDPKQAEELTEELLQIGRMLNSMMDKAHLFCGESDYVVRDRCLMDTVETDD